MLKFNISNGATTDAYEVFKGVSTIEATEAAASVIFANSYMYNQLSTLHRVDYITHTV